MPHELTILSPTSPPARQSRAQADLLGAYRSRITQEPDGTWSISEDCAPTCRDLELLQARRAELAVVGNAVPKEIGAVVARMFQRFPAYANKEAPEMVAAYVKDLSKFPLWAIIEGISRILNGVGMKPPEHPPSSPVVVDRVRAAMTPILDEAVLLDQVIGATVVRTVPLSADERKAIADAVRASMRAHAPPPDEPPPRRAGLPSAFDAHRDAMARERVEIGR